MDAFGLRRTSRRTGRRAEESTLLKNYRFNGLLEKMESEGKPCKQERELAGEAASKATHEHEKLKVKSRSGFPRLLGPVGVPT